MHNSPEWDAKRTDTGNMTEPFSGLFVTGNNNKPPTHTALQISPKTVVLSKRTGHRRLQTARSRSRDVSEKAKLWRHKSRLAVALKRCFWIVVVVLQVCAAIHAHRIIRFTWPQSVSGELTSDEADKRLS